MSMDRDESGRPAAGLRSRRRAEDRLRGRTRVLSLAAVAFGCVYFFVRQFLKDGLWRFDLTLVNKSLGTAALLLIALSMAVTGWSYFSGRSAKGLAYRKPFGLAGFWLGLAHGAVEHVLLPAVGLRSESGPGTRHAEALGLAALAVFALMALASNARARERMGSRRWRKFLRYAGYAGLVLAVAHAALLKGASWAKFFRTFKPALPSLSLPVALFAAFVALTRLAVWIAEKRKGRGPTSASPDP
jgi:DMSO/TMAO reductase YedYZ heme-binding membrane subunit